MPGISGMHGMPQSPGMPQIHGMPGMHQLNAMSQFSQSSQSPFFTDESEAPPVHHKSKIPLLPPHPKTVKKQRAKDKTALDGAGVVVIDQPPLVCSSADGWRGACLTLCKTAYVRNNKRGGLKNLRCFPHCLTDGHNPLGFCGSGLFARVWLPNNVAPSK